MDEIQRWELRLTDQVTLVPLLSVKCVVVHLFAYTFGRKSYPFTSVRTFSLFQRQ